MEIIAILIGLIGSAVVLGVMATEAIAQAASNNFPRKSLSAMRNMSREYQFSPEKAETRPPPKREPGFGSRSLSDQRGQIMPLPSSGS